MKDNGGRFLLTIPQISSLRFLLWLLILEAFWLMDGWMDSRYLATFSVYFISVNWVVPLLCYFMNYSGPLSGRYFTPENWLNCSKLLLHHKLCLSSPVLFIFFWKSYADSDFFILPNWRSGNSYLTINMMSNVYS